MSIYNNKKKKFINRTASTPSQPQSCDSNDPAKSLVPPLDKPALDILEGAVDQFKAEAPDGDFSKIVHSPKVMAQLDAALDRIRHRKKLFDEWGLKAVDPRGSSSVINFFGPPGTGKSMTADAIAHELGLSIIKVSYAKLESKYVGDTPKNIERAFEAAKQQNAVIFFDEADSILGKRLSSVTQGADHSVNVSRSVMLLAMDKFEGVVVFATNLAQNYDSAFVRRIHNHIKFELPDLAAREQIFKKMLVPQLPLGPEVTAKSLATLSEGLSGGDLRTTVINAAAKAVSRTGLDQLVKKVDFEQAIQETLKAKQEISKSTTMAQVSEEEVPVTELSEDVQAKYEQAVS